MLPDCGTHPGCQPSFRTSHCLSSHVAASGTLCADSHRARARARSRPNRCLSHACEPERRLQPAKNRDRQNEGYSAATYDQLAEMPPSIRPGVVASSIPLSCHRGAPTQTRHNFRERNCEEEPPHSHHPELPAGSRHMLGYENVPHQRSQRDEYRVDQKSSPTEPLHGI